MSDNKNDKTMFAMRISKTDKEELKNLYYDMGDRKSVV